MKVSVIVPIYNVEEYLRRCVESLTSQTYKDIEIILVDDESPDNAGKICDELALKDDRIKVIHKKNGGASSARNTGLKASTGDIIHFCDADDWIEPDTYETIVGKMQDNNADVAYFGWYVDSGNNDAVEQNSNAFDGVGNQYDLFYNILIKCGTYGGKAGYGNYIWNKMYRKSKLYNKDGELVLFDENVAIAEDGLWLVDVARNWNVCVMDNRPFYHYFKNPGSVMGSPERYQEVRLGSEASHMRMLDILRDFNKDLYEVHKKTCTDFFWTHARSNPEKRNSAFVGQVITNIIAINDGVCPESLAKSILFLMQKYTVLNRQSNRKIMKGAAKVQNFVDKTILKKKEH